MAVSDDRQRMMPMPEDRVTGQVLDYPEAVLLTKPTNQMLRGEVFMHFSFSSRAMFQVLYILPSSIYCTFKRGSYI